MRCLIIFIKCRLQCVRECCIPQDKKNILPVISQLLRESQGLETEKGGNNIVVPFMLDLVQSHAGIFLWDTSVLSDCFLILLCWKQLLFLWARPLIICCQSCDSSWWVYWVIRDVCVGRLCWCILTSQRLWYRIGHVLQLLCQTHSDSNSLAVWNVPNCHYKAHHYSLIWRNMPFLNHENTMMLLMFSN